MAKQVHRRIDARGRFAGDLVARADEPPPEGTEALLVPVVRGGRLVEPLPTLEAVRDRCRAQLAALPEEFKRLDSEAVYPVVYSDVLEADAERIMNG